MSSALVSTSGSGHCQLADLLQEKKVDTLICGGIGGGAKNKLADANIKLYGGVSGSADEAVAALLAGKLQYDPEIQCSHHGEQQHGHDCHGGHDHGGHGCGGHAH